MTSREESSVYHLAELEIAADPGHPAHLNPVLPPGARVLDLGCGAGQTLIAAAPEGCRPVGVDRDLAALALGRTLGAREGNSGRRFPFVCAAGEALPFRAASFDRVFARVALPYMDLPRALAEGRRVLRSGGGFWATLHPAAVPWRALRGANPRGKLYQLLVLANGLLFHLTLRLARLPGRRFESFQTASAVRRALAAAGFAGIGIERGRHFVATAKAAPAVPPIP